MNMIKNLPMLFFKFFDKRISRLFQCFPKIELILLLTLIEELAYLFIDKPI